MTERLASGLRRLLIALVAVLCTALPALTGVALAGDGPLPLIPKGKGERCVEDTAFMRRHHMELLKHQRDETMHRGIRTTQYSLQQCITCHVVDGAEGKPLTIADSKHFCNSCHSYAAVSVDCFACHASTPSGAAQRVSAHE